MHPKPAHRVALNTPAETAAAHLSALMDGQADALEPACRAWREGAAARATWHRYHLIGDALRAESLVAAPAHDAAFLQALRARLATEPVRLAPDAGDTRARQGWRVPVAVAASAVLVVGSMAVARLGPAGAAAPALAQATDTHHGTQRDAVVPALLTDARLDEFLRAHRAAAGGLGAAAAGGSLRPVGLLVPVSARP
jgi:sigma-E factor negative regulatory protein RseA